MNAVDYNTDIIPEEPIFLPQHLDSDHYFRTPTLSVADSVSLTETRSFSSFATIKSLKGF